MRARSSFRKRSRASPPRKGPSSPDGLPPGSSRASSAMWRGLCGQHPRMRPPSSGHAPGFFPAAQQCGRRKKATLSMSSSDDATDARAPACLWRLRIRPASAVPDVPTAPCGSRFPPCPPAVPAQGSGPQAVEFRSTDNPSLPMRMPYALRGNNGKDRKVKPCGGLLVDEDAQSIRTFYILQKPPIFLHKV